MASLFTKIINSEIPAHKVYEDHKTLAFLDIFPTQPGHTLVVPKAEVDRFEDLSDEDYQALWKTVRKVARRMREVLGRERVCLKVEGFDVPHAHIHLFACDTAADFYARPDHSKEPDHDSLAAMAERLRF